MQCQFIIGCYRYSIIQLFTVVVPEGFETIIHSE